MRISPWRVPNFQLPLPPEPKPPLAEARPAQNTTTGWLPLPGLGRSGNAHAVPLTPATATTAAVTSTAAAVTSTAAAAATAASATPAAFAAPPILAFDYTLAANAPTTTIARVHLLPTHPIDGTGKLRIACTLDAGTAPPRPAELTINDGGPEWAQGVLANERTIDIPLPPAALTAGAHTLRLHGITPGIIVDRVTIE
jgi:hypothetical protein